ncbi:MAG: radical SAM protein [Candidatus Cloacimonetes bacterium]|nr:radical SAM protein [Candidatus Cloacimonadota bacterium]
MLIYPIFLPNIGCPFRCIFCDQKIITRQTAINKQEIVGKIRDFCQRITREEVEIAFYGGTFTRLPVEFQDLLFQTVQPYLGKVGIRISTRPDTITNDDLIRLKKAGVKTIELGIQSFSDTVLAESHRGYNSQTARKTADLIKESNLKLCLQLMPGLPGSNQSTFLDTIRQVLAIKPDYVRIYPAVILKGTDLEKLYVSGLYKPLSLDKAIEVTADMITEFESAGIRIIKTGLHSDISPADISGGPYHRQFGELVRKELLWRDLQKNFVKDKTLVFSDRDISLFLGDKKELLTKIKATFGLTHIPVCRDENLGKGKFYFAEVKPHKYW